jgi:hypothetical protein
MRFTAERHCRSIFERYLIRQAVEPGTHPVDVPVDEGTGFIKIALKRKRDDDGATRAADAKRQTSCSRMTTHFDLRTDAFEVNRSRF